MQTSKVRASHEEWNYQVAQDLGLLQRPALALPSWDRRGEDPLEEIVHPFSRGSGRVLWPAT